MMDNEKILKYEEPKMWTVVFNRADVLTSSGGDPFGGEEDLLAF